MAGEAPLGGERGPHGPGRAAKGGEEGVTLSVDLYAAALLDRVAQDRSMIVPDGRIPVASSCSSRVEPSMSVNRKVTVPVGSSADPGLGRDD